MIGKKVTVKVDRPMGSYHPQHKDMFYPINYGYIEGIIAPDGEEQDAYLLGVSGPVQEYTGIIIAIIRRFDDIEEKWVVVPEGMLFTKEKSNNKRIFKSNISNRKLECKIPVYREAFRADKQSGLPVLFFIVPARSAWCGSASAPAARLVAQY